MAPARRHFYLQFRIGVYLYRSKIVSFLVVQEMRIRSIFV